MSSATATREVAEVAAGAGPKAASLGATVHARKLRVMAKCSEIAPDKTHPAHNFRYVSIQNLSNHLRRFCAEEGLDVVCSITDGTVVVELINADAPDERIVTTWPVVSGDKGYAFSIKFPLMRLFLVGDGEEADEAEMATASGAAATRQAQQPARTLPPARTSTGPTVKPLGECKECADEGLTAKGGRPAVFWPAKRADQVPTCNGMRGDDYVNHRMLAVDPVGPAEQRLFSDGSPVEEPF